MEEGDIDDHDFEDLHLIRYLFFVVSPYVCVCVRVGDHYDGHDDDHAEFDPAH